MEIGIVGLPNVGKSTLFNALLKKQAALAANYPFATIEPNVGVVPVPDDRLAQLAKVVGTTRLVNATVKFVDIAGLVKGASQGEGLGNKFLAHIREVDAIMFILRDFSDENIIRAGSTDPKSDQEILETELILADLETAKKIQDTKDKDIKILGNRIVSELEKGTPIRALQFTESEEKAVKQMSFLTSKPVIVVFNTDEQKLQINDNNLRICAKLESELAELSDDEQKDYLKQLGIEKSGLELVIQKAFDVLGLQTFLTAGEKEARAWTIKKGSTAPQAAGVIHNDFEKHFIKAECVNFTDFVQFGGWAKCRELGKVRMEGRDYVMQDGDVVEFKVGV
jgi:GTP-binding protein YchF